MQGITAFAIRFDQSLADLRQLTVESSRALRAAHTADTARIIDELRAFHAPSLRTKLAEVTVPIDRFKFNTRVVPLLGRERELAELHAYLDKDAALLWCVWVGDGGVGKSRLMLEFALEAQYRGWAAGFLADDDPFNSAQWKPQRDTLIIIDYVATRAEQTRKNIVALHDRADIFEKKVRFVLLERSAEETDDWFHKFCSTGSDATVLNNHRHAAPRKIDPPDEESVWGVFAHFVRHRDPKSKRVSDADLAKLKPVFQERVRKQPVQQRPLFACFAGDLVADQGPEDFKKWDSDTLVKLVLDREIEKRWRGKVDREYANLLVLTTMVGGLTREQLYNAAAELGNLPDMDSFSQDAYRVLTGYEPDPQEHELPPLLPDLLGECFILERLAGRCAIAESEGNPDAIQDFAKRALTWLWDNDAFPTGKVTLRTVRDFPNHLSVPTLLEFVDGAPILWGAMIADAAGYDLDVTLTDKLLHRLVNSPAPALIKAGAFYNRGVGYDQRGDSGAAIVDYTTVIDMPDAPAEQKAQALINRGVRHGQRWASGAEIADYTAVIDMPDAPAEHKAKALVNRGITYGQRGDSDAEIADYAAVIDMPDAPAEQKAWALHNRGASHGQRGDSDAEIADYTAVIDMADAPNSVKCKALLGRAMMFAYSNANENAQADLRAATGLASGDPELESLLSQFSSQPDAGGDDE